jgi:4-diphosphocytidyl-2C-methyl-D-erythritol kinase
MALELLSPAKVNLFLDVISKRPDGFHNIFTVFERIDLFDRIVMDVIKDEIIIETDNKDIPRGKDNLAFKAAELFLKKFRVKKGLHIRINKNIPVAAGLGGGSSDAATVLLGANRLFGLRLKKSELIPLAKKIGSDVAFFLEETSFAIGEGRGDIITPLKINKRFWHILIYPNIKVYTKDIYEKVKIDKNNTTPMFTNYCDKRIKLRNLREKLNLTHSATPQKAGSLGSQSRPAKSGVSLNVNYLRKENIENPDVSSGPSGYTNMLTKYIHGSINTLLNHNTIIYNKLEKIVLEKFSLVRQVKEILESYGIKSLVSGSGPTVFGLLNSRKEAELIREKLSSEYDWQIFLTRTC